MLNFISTAHATQQAPSLSSSSLMSFVPIIAIFVIFYFLMIRPQQKKMKEHKAMVDAIQIGDRVLTAGGITGTVSKIIDANEVKIMIAPQTEVSVVRSSLSQVYTQTNNQPANNKTIQRADKIAGGQENLVLSTKLDNSHKSTDSTDDSMTLTTAKSPKAKSKIVKATTQSKFDNLKKKNK